jgi:superfamily II DNA/RNA helicase
MTFSDLISEESILKAIAEAGYTTPTPIQGEAIPKIMEGLDLLASAQTGTGKTAAFILPTLCKFAKDPKHGKGPRVLILVPTRELAQQVADVTAKYTKYLPKVKTVCIYGGAPYPIQNRQLSRPYDILVATPGRLIDHVERGRISFERLELLILDEADRMLDMGFIDPVKEIAALTPKNRQTLLFSATLKGNVLQLANSLLKNPVKITIEAPVTKHENIEQRLHNVDNLDHKYRLLDSLLEDQTMNQVVIFTATKSQADILADKLTDSGHSAAALHGDMRQRARTRTLTDLRQGKIRILVATDVAARGIDVQSISHVINFDLPMSVEDYVHRIGRTGRAGATGIALSFAAHKDMYLVREIERFTGQKITPHVIAGLEAKRRSEPFNKTRRAGPGARRPFQKRYR